MAFFESILSKNETLLSKTRIHWWAYVRGVFFLLIGLIILGSKFNILLSALYYMGVFFLIWDFVSFKVKMIPNSASP